MTRLCLLFLLGCASAPLEPTQAAPIEVASTPQEGPINLVFPPPPGTDRHPADPFATYLQSLKVLGPEVPITTHDGQVVNRAGRVLDLDLVRGDLQQCADTAIRLRAQWLKDTGREVMFHATSGDPLPWARYRGGERPTVKNDRIAWRPGGDKAWDSYLRAVFTWAGTASLAAHDTTPVRGEPQPGDLLVDPGFPGHAVILVDVATRDEETYLLIAQGFMPAQTAHIVPGPHAGWWRWEPGLRLPVWSFEAAHLRRFRAP